MNSKNSRTNKQNLSLFPLLVSLSLLLLTGLVFIIIYRTESSLLTSLFARTLNIILIAIVFMLSGAWLKILLFESYSWRLGRYYKPVKWMLFFYYYPISKLLCIILRINKEKLQLSFIAFQNRLFFPNAKLGSNARLLLLLPHCLQYHDCKIRLTHDINNCEDCGECNICNLKDIAKRYEINISVATGGTLARKVVNETMPDAIIAVACHRDLTDGVRESWIYPVYGILNERPFGPCIDTKVDIDKVTEILNRITSQSNHK